MEVRSGKKNSFFIKDYLVITLPGAEYKRFQVNMVNKNDNLNLINIEFKDFKNDFSFYYNCSGMERLSEYIKVNSVDNKFLLNLFYEITKKYSIFEEYLLDFDNLIINTDYIFIDKNGKLKFIYIPSNYYDENNSIYKLYEELKNNSNLDIFENKKLKDMLMKSRIKELSEFLNKKLDENKINYNKKVNKESRLNVGSKRKKFNLLKPYEVNKTNLSLEGLILGIFIQVLLLISFLFINYFKMLPLIMGSYTLSFILFLIIFGLFTAILWEIIIMNFRFNYSNKDSKKIGKEAILSNNNKNIIIDSDEFFIGRLKDNVDLYLDDKMIGKIHAKIEKVKDKYYIYDLNSKNGTFINGNKVERYKMFEILNNDKITFAFCDYQFIIQDKLV